MQILISSLNAFDESKCKYKKVTELLFHHYFLFHFVIIGSFLVEALSTGCFEKKLNIYM